ncbi:MAG TPA: hypothetical protein VHN77_03745 [Phycisphaerales bacterium]|nr:hypothetical protein [Phycisphaerales bacterium]
MPAKTSTAKRRNRGGEWWWRVWALLPWAVGLGVTTSVVCSAIAYAVTAEDWFVNTDGERGSIEGDALRAVEFRRLGRTFVHVTIDAADAPALRSSALASQVTGPLLPFREAILDDRTQGIGATTVYCFATGFPMRCFQGADFPDAWPEPASVGLWKLGELGERVICYQPRWLGLSVNTAFWGAMWLGVLAVPAAMRGSRRRAKGLCPVCAYDLKGELNNGCPECGWNRDDVRPPVLTAAPASPGTP